MSNRQVSIVIPQGTSYRMRYTSQQAYKFCIAWANISAVTHQRCSLDSVRYKTINY